MIELIRQSLTRQFEAALSMLHNSLVDCPPNQWEQPVGAYPFWHAAYHCLFYLDLYLSPSEAAFAPQPFHRHEYQYFDVNPEGESVTADEPYDKETLLRYATHCRKKLEQVMASEMEQSLEGPSGFWWYPIPRAEFHVNNIRHVQHHAAQLSLHVRRTAGVQVPWSGSGWKDHDAPEA